MIQKVVLRSSYFYILSLILVITLFIITLLVTLKGYVWDESNYEDKSSFVFFLIDNHPFFMTAVLLINAFCIQSLIVLNLKLMIVFTSKAILTLRILKTNSALGITHTILATIHGSLNCFAVLMSLSPIYVLISGLLSHRVSLHFYSIHCWLGVITVFALIVQLISALVFYTWNTFFKMRKTLMDGFRNIHLIAGYSLFYMLALNTVLGLSEKGAVTSPKFPKYYSLALLFKNLMAISVVCLGLIVFYSVFWRRRLELSLILIRNNIWDERKRFMKRVKEKAEKRSKKVIRGY